MHPLTHTAVPKHSKAKRYEGLAGHSGIRSYAMGRDRIVIEFQDGRCYLYNSTRPGSRHVRNMIRLARKGIGLTTYINQHVRENYAERLQPDQWR